MIYGQQQTAFNIACVCNRGDSLLKVVPEVLSMVDYQGSYNRLYEACRIGCQKAVELILDMHSTLVNEDSSIIVKEPEHTPLYAACIHGHSH